MPYYCDTEKKDCYFRDMKRKTVHGGPYLSQRACIEKSAECLPYACEKGDCVSDANGIYDSKEACGVLCNYKGVGGSGGGAPCKNVTKAALRNIARKPDTPERSKMFALLAKGDNIRAEISTLDVKALQARAKKEKVDPMRLKAAGENKAEITELIVEKSGKYCTIDGVSSLNLLRNEETLFCKKLQDSLFSYLDFDLNCDDTTQQNLNIVLFIAIIWIGILLF